MRSCALSNLPVETQSASSSPKRFTVVDSATRSDARSPAVVSVAGLTRTYGEIEALRGVSFEVHEGEIFGILGPNGAGKTTLVEILEGLRRPSGGAATVLGAAADAGDARTRERMGVVMQDVTLPELLSPDELLRLYGALYRNPVDRSELLESLGLADKRKALAKTLSGGQKQRLALALVGRPSLLFLDEPTSGLDPQARRAIWDLLLDPDGRARRTVILTTHQMEEAHQLCSRVAIIDQGEILAIGTPAELVAEYAPSRRIRFTVDDASALAALRLPATTTSLPTGEIEATIEAAAIEDVLSVVMAAHGRGDLAVRTLSIEQGTLEDVFLELTGREIRS